MQGIINVCNTVLIELILVINVELYIPYLYLQTLHVSEFIIPFHKSSRTNYQK